MRRFVTAVAALTVISVLSTSSVNAWGIKGHTIIGEAAMASLPAELPPFMRAEASQQEIIYLQAEEDRLKIDEDHETAWAREWTTDHYLDIADDDLIGGAVSITALPATRDDFDNLLQHAQHPIDPYSVGFLPYAILEGYEQVRSDFALWRFATAQESRATGSARKSAAAMVTERANLTIHDIGICSHFVGDGSQPLHVTIHYNGWGPYPNPEDFTESKSTHADFESAFVGRYLTAADVVAEVGRPQVFSAVPLAEIERYLQTTHTQVRPFYALEKGGAFNLSDTASVGHRKAIEFTTQRLAAASQMLDSLILTAWRTSAEVRPGE
jgi:hypothetical protein